MVSLRCQSEGLVTRYWGRSVYMTPFSTKNQKLFMFFGRSLTWHWHSGGLKMLNGFLKVIPLSSPCKLQKRKFVFKKTVTLCACILRVQSISLREFLYKLTLPTTDLAWIIQHFLLCVQGSFWQYCCLYMKLSKNAKEKCFHFQYIVFV